MLCSLAFIKISTSKSRFISFLVRSSPEKSSGVHKRTNSTDRNPEIQSYSLQRYFLNSKNSSNKKDAQADVIHKSVSNFRLQVHFKHNVYHGNHCLHFYCIFTFKKCSRKFLAGVSWENVSAAKMDLQDNAHQLYQTSFKSAIRSVQVSSRIRYCTRDSDLLLPLTAAGTKS